MTSFDMLESSAEGGRPIEIYRFTLGFEEFLYTSSSADITLGTTVYESIPIRRDRIVIGQSERKRVLQIRVPITNAFVRRYIGIPPGQKATLNLSRLQRDETPSVTTEIDLYQGSVLSVQFPTAADAEISVQTREAASSRHVPRYTYMGMCNHTLYGVGCDVDPLSYRFVGTVSAISGNIITVPGASLSGFVFTGGFCKPAGATTDFRVILKDNGIDDLTLLLPFPTSIVGSSIDCFAGCNHLIGGDCALVYNNVIRNGSFSFVPSINIFTKGVK